MERDHREWLREHGWGVVPILPRQGLYLKVHPKALEVLAKIKGHRPGEYLADAFRDVWRRLPLSARRALLRYWRTHPGWLRIELTDAPHRAGACDHDGFTLKFAFYMDLPHPPDSGLDTPGTVAHELAHAYRYATLSEVGWAIVGVREEEEATRRLAESWGFSQEPFDPRAYKEELALERKYKRLRRKAAKASAMSSVRRPAGQ